MRGSRCLRRGKSTPGGAAARRLDHHLGTVGDLTASARLRRPQSPPEARGICYQVRARPSARTQAEEIWFTMLEELQSNAHTISAKNGAGGAEYGGLLKA
mmetsp:Transcript_22479/g.67636  ORF Transcript_22479/g.67636 Transcript_22479/m.67636 type:complete len:100 (+) Transcript_22479:1019-1318(+)